MNNEPKSYQYLHVLINVFFSDKFFRFLFSTDYAIIFPLLYFHTYVVD